MPRSPGRGSLSKRVDDAGRLSYVADYVDSGGVRRRRIVGGDLATAQRVLAKLVRDRDLETAGMGVERGADLEVAAIVAQYLDDLRGHSSPRHVRETEASLGRMVEAMSARLVRHLTRDRVAAWRSGRVKAGASHKRVNNEVVALRAALAHALSLGQLAADPLAGMKALPVTAKHRRREPRALTEDEIGRLLAAAERADAAQRAVRGTFAPPIPRAPLLRALIATGARWHELVSTTWADLDAERGTLRLRPETTKTGRARTIPLDAETLAALSSLQTLRRSARILGGSAGLESSRHVDAQSTPDSRQIEAIDRAGRIFLTPEGAAWPRSTKNFSRWLRGVLAQAGIPKRDHTGRVVCVHAMRHTFATRLARAGVSVATIAALTGHRSAQMVLRYCDHATSDDARDAIRSLPPLRISHERKPASDEALERLW